MLSKHKEQVMVLNCHMVCFMVASYSLSGRKHLCRSVLILRREL